MPFQAHMFRPGDIVSLARAAAQAQVCSPARLGFTRTNNNQDYI